MLWYPQHTAAFKQTVLGICDPTADDNLLAQIPRPGAHGSQERYLQPQVRSLVGFIAIIFASCNYAFSLFILVHVMF